MSGCRRPPLPLGVLWLPSSALRTSEKEFRWKEAEVWAVVADGGGRWYSDIDMVVMGAPAGQREAQLYLLAEALHSSGFHDLQVIPTAKAR